MIPLIIDSFASSCIENSCSTINIYLTILDTNATIKSLESVNLQILMKSCCVRCDSLWRTVYEASSGVLFALDSDQNDFLVWQL